MRAGFKRLKAADWLCLAIYFVLLTVMGVCFVSQENTFYWSDYNYYEIVTNVVREKISQSPVKAVVEVPLLIFASTSLTHNLIFTLPLSLFELVFGHGRLQFVLALLYVYLTSYLFTLAALVSSAVPEPVAADAAATKRKAFWTTVFTALAIPVIWVPSLRGYPDMAPAAVLTLAAFLYLRAKNYRQLALVGILSAFAPLLRRHFAYGAIALALVILIDQIRAPLKIAEKIKNLAIMASAGALFMASFGALFVTNILSCDYSALYKSFALTFTEALGYFSSTYGAVTLATALGGIVWALRQGNFIRRNLYFTTAFATFSIVIWMVTQRQLGAHYTLYFDWFVICGNALLVYQLTSRAACAGLAVFALVNFALAFLPADQCPLKSTRPGMLSKPLREGTPMSYLFSANYAPYIRRDREQIIAMAQRLRTLTDGKGPDCLVLVNAQSDILDVDIVRNGERALGGESRIPMAEVPATDSRDSYPVEVLLHSRYVVTTEPDQTLLTADRQKIILAVNRCFAQNWPLATAFKKLDQQFSLDDGVKATIYERVRPNSETEAARTLDLMASFIGVKPGSQPAWISSAVAAPVSYQGKLSSYKFKGDENYHAFLLSVSPISAKNIALNRPVHVTGRLVSADKNASAWISALATESKSRVLPARSFVRPGQTFEAFADLLGSGISGNSHLVLLVEPGEGHKPFAITDLKIEE